MARTPRGEPMPVPSRDRRCKATVRGVQCKRVKWRDDLCHAHAAPKECAKRQRSPFQQIAALEQQLADAQRERETPPGVLGEKLRLIVNVLGPTHPKGLTCAAEPPHSSSPRDERGCQGCQYEWSTALSYAREALTAADALEARAASLARKVETLTALENAVVEWKVSGETGVFRDPRAIKAEHALCDHAYRIRAARASAASAPIEEPK